MIPMYVQLAWTMRYMLQQATTHTIYLRYSIYDNCVIDVDGVHFSDIDLFVHILYEVYIEIHEQLFRYDMAAWAVSLVCISQIHEVLFYKPYWKYRFHRQSHRINVRVSLYKLHIKCVRRDQYRKRWTTHKCEHHQHHLHNYHKYCTSSKS